MAQPTSVNGLIIDAITRIRQLKATGKHEEAAKELELFSKAYPDYELPADLK